MNIILSTTNPSKAEQIKAIFEGFPYKVLTLKEAGISGEAVEDGLTLAENALKKARFAHKIGSWAMADDTTVALDRLDRLAQIVDKLLLQNNEILIVTSGAVGLGRGALKVQGAISLTEKQACASVGQTVLMHTYQSVFQKYNRVCGQVLLTAQDLENRNTYL
jgi:glutamate 5-kinase